jgi:lipoprotein-releasing system permease protein
MVLPLSLRIGLKYFFCRNNKQNTTKAMAKICFLSIAIGTFALMLTLIITNGFEKVISEKMQGMSSHVVINLPGKKLDEKAIESALRLEFPDEIEAVSGSTIKQVIMDYKDDQASLFVKGIYPETEVKVSSLFEKLSLPRKKNLTLPELLTENKILIGHKMATSHNLQIGSEIFVLVPKPYSKNKISLTKQKVVVSGIFNIGLEEYDSNFAFCNIDFLREVFEEPSGVDTISLAIKEPVETFFEKISVRQGWEDDFARKLREQFPGLCINSWRELYPALVSSLKLEKYLSFLIIALITLVACMNMISLLYMQIQQKRKDIAILKSIGMRSKSIARIFIFMGLSLACVASIFGLAVAAGVGFILQNFPFIQLPDVYFVSYLPARIEFSLFIVVFSCTMFLAFIATWIPARKLRKIKISKILRFG